MKNRTLTVGLIGVALVSTAFAADWIIAPGRWETTGEVHYGPKRPAGMPAVHPYSDVDCISEKWALAAHAPLNEQNIDLAGLQQSGVEFA